MIRSLYKADEPFMEAPNANGFLGVVMYDDQNDKVQCHVCGKWFFNVGKHINFSHDLTAREYKVTFGLTQKTALCGINYSSYRREIMKKNIYDKKCANDGGKALKIMLKKRRNWGNGNKTMSRKNQFGLCDLQIKARYDVFKKQSKGDYREKTLREYDKRLWSALIRRHGTINKARLWLGDNPIKKGEWSTIPNTHLIAELRRYAKEHHCRPKSTDFISNPEYPGQKAYYSHFGSWSQALCAAGL